MSWAFAKLETINFQLFVNKLDDFTIVIPKYT